MKTKFIILILIAAFNPFRMAAQDTTYLNLDGVITRMLSSYPALLQYSLQARALEAQAEGARSWMPPSISVSAESFPYNLSQLTTMSPENNAGLMFSLEQMIPNFKKINTRFQYLQSLANVRRSDSVRLRDQLIFSAAQLFYQRLISERRASILNQNLDVLQLLISTAEENNRYNRSNLSTIYKAQAKLPDIKNMLLMQRSSISEADVGLNILMNRPTPSQFSIDTTIPIERLKNLIATTNDSIIARRGDIAALEKSIASMKLNIVATEANLLPDFGLRFSHGQMFGMPNQFSVMGVMTLPFVPWASTMYTADIQAMRLNIEAMQKERESMVLMARRMSTERRVMLRYAFEQTENIKTHVIPAYEKNLEVSLLAFKQNTTDFFIVLDAWEMLLMKQIEYWNRMGDVLQTKTELEYELGDSSYE